MRHGRFPFIFGFLAAPVALYSVLVIWPVIQTFYISMTNWRGLGKPPTWAGFDNYTRLFGEDGFWQAITNNLKLLIVMPLVTIAIALFFAFLLNVGGGSKGGQRKGVWGWLS